MYGRKLYLFTVVQIVVIGALVWSLIFWNGPWNVERKVGTALVVLGIIFIAIARLQLGYSFSIRAEAHKLVTTGLYSKIRNPIYVFGMVMVTGVILVFQNPVLWIMLPVLAIGQAIRARKEARVLESAFGDEYREYRKKTWF
ncbi:MAG TPA: isoprenylcysteine carboxylmethyltransferase family protein [Candidatus Sulfotelmatobacter sp.]|nr:isoprenylcysteine carboxylmethyltransferase family protein [Candidatus Sulfotelmatobacter sp.]